MSIRSADELSLEDVHSEQNNWSGDDPTCSATEDKNKIKTMKSCSAGEMDSHSAADDNNTRTNVLSRSAGEKRKEESSMLGYGYTL